MSIFGKLIKIGMDVVELPVAAIKDTFTMGGVLEDEPHPYTIKKLKEIGEDWSELKEEVEKD